jgi:arylsulfatase A-like enzyme
MKKIQILALALIIVGSALCQAVDAPSGPGTPPNIVFIYADDWGWGDLSSHSHPWLKTPNIDRLAAGGIDFLQFNVLNPVCSPSRAAALTGMCPARFSIHEHFDKPLSNAKRGMPDWLDPEAPLLSRFLKNAGYRTGHFGKWHLTNAGCQGAPAVTAYGFDQAGVFNGPPGFPKEGASSRDTADNTVRFIRESKGRPFFVNAWLKEPHTPHAPSEQSMEKWKHLDKQKQVYAAVITDGDNKVGKILAALDEAGVAENTLVIFSSDNGPEETGPDKGEDIDPKANFKGYGLHYSVGDTGGLRGRKRSLFEGGVRTPFIVRWPGHAPAGTTNDKTVITAVDLLPTLCAAAGVSLPKDYRGDGENLLAAFNGKQMIRTRPVFWEWRGGNREPNMWADLAVREGDWKLLMTEDGNRTELYQLDQDRAEARDVSSEHPEIVARLTALVREWKASLPEASNPKCISEEVRRSPAAADAPSASKKAESAAATKARLQEFRHTPESEARLNKWFRDAKFGAFIHFGAYSTLAGKYKDKMGRAYAEWIQVDAAIPSEEYRREVASRFNPQEFDAEEWVRMFKENGMRYVVITSKHHDGFALYDSACSDYDVLDASPFKRDIIKEFSEACHKHGLKFGVYYSHAQDWSDPDSTSFFKPQFLKKLFPELPADRKPDVDAYIARKALPQIKELMSNYDIDLIWFDTPNGLTPEQARRFHDAIRELNPDCVINSRVVLGSVLLKKFNPDTDLTPEMFEVFDFVSLGDKEVPSAKFPFTTESPDSVSSSYGYKAHGKHTYHSLQELIHRLVHTVCGGGNYLLNCGPMGNGKIDPKAVELYAGLGAWLRDNHESSSNKLT